jgi:NAD(P)-dependent dehydrogenase (short-subunit alcohol dehydrogenase family)
LVESVNEELGAISVLVNNAGRSTSALPAGTLDPAEVESALRTHALGPLVLSQLVLPSMREQARGDIVMISSSAPRIAAKRTAAYTMAKAAMEAFAYVLAKEEMRYGIRVNVVAPGLVATRMGTAVVRGIVGDDAAVVDFDQQAPFGRVCRPEDVGNVVAFLVSPAGSYISGECIRVDGGAPDWAPRR